MLIQLSDHFTYRKLLSFTLPSIFMMIFTSIYVVVDGLFVSNFVGKTSFAALNLIWPVIQGVGTIGSMIGTGGSALVSKTLGEGKRDEANQIFSMLIYFSILVGAALSAVALFFLEPIAVLLGAEGAMVEQCVLYGSILLPATAAFILQNEFLSFFAAAEKPGLGLAITIAAGATNIVMDALFIAVFDWGLAGAALATALSQVVGGLIPLLYFCSGRSGILRLTKARFDGKALLHTCTNGASELMTNLSMSLVNILYNFQLMRFAGENGVAAYGVIMYLNFVFVAIFLGYSIGITPVIGFHHGAQNHAELRNLRKKSLSIIGLSSLGMVLLGVALARPLSAIFVGYDTELLQVTQRGMLIYCISFLFTGFNIFGSAFFTALNNGAVSAAISFLRTLLFQTLAVIVLPVFLKLDGIWLAIIAAEFTSILVVLFFFLRMQKRYQY